MAGSGEERKGAVAHACVTVPSKGNTTRGGVPHASAILREKEMGETHHTGLPRDTGKEVSRLPTVGGTMSEDFLFLFFILKVSMTSAVWRLGDMCSQAASKL